MNKYTIRCTEEQTRKALELGAPLQTMIYRFKDYSKDLFVEEGKDYFIPTTDQMIGWLEEQGILVLVEPSQNKFYGAYSLKREDGCWLNRIFLDGLYASLQNITSVIKSKNI